MTEPVALPLCDVCGNPAIHVAKGRSNHPKGNYFWKLCSKHRDEYFERHDAILKQMKDGDSKLIQPVRISIRPK